MPGEPPAGVRGFRQDAARLTRVAVMAATVWGVTGERPAEREEPRPTPPEPVREVLDATPRVSLDEWIALGEEGRRQRDTEHLNAQLDSIVITQRVAPGTPFEERVGEVNDPRILAVMKDIDQVLGGNIEWPNVTVVDGLTEGHNALGRYQSPGRFGDGRTVDPKSNEGQKPEDHYGIVLDKGFIDRELRDGKVTTKSVRSLVVHELQHATSHDNAVELARTGRRTDFRHERSSPYAEGRADLAMVVEAEMRQRRDSPGPKLNELTQEDRRVVVAETLDNFIDPGRYEAPYQDAIDATVHRALSVDNYLRFGHNDIWEEVRDERTDRYVNGLDGYDGGDKVFVPSGMDENERLRQLTTPLDELAQEWTAQRRERPVSFDQWSEEDGRYTRIEAKFIDVEPLPEGQGQQIEEIRISPGMVWEKPAGQEEPSPDQEPQDKAEKQAEPREREGKLQASDRGGTENAPTSLQQALQAARKPAEDAGPQAGTQKAPTALQQALQEAAGSRGEGSGPQAQTTAETGRAATGKASAALDRQAPPPAEPPAPAGAGRATAQRDQQPAQQR